MCLSLTIIIAGDADSTYWGGVRAYEDGHPAPYNITIFELGNEQYNPNWVAQVRKPPL